MQIASSSVFTFESSHWESGTTLNPTQTTEVVGTDALLPAYSTAPLNALKLCTIPTTGRTAVSFSSVSDSAGKPTHCYTYSFESAYTNALALFSIPYNSYETSPETSFGQKAFEKLWTSDLHDARKAVTAGHEVCTQRPGVNSKCNDNNWVRFGFCGNLPHQPCQPANSDDSDFAIGIGCKGQNTPTNWGAGFNDYYTYSDLGSLNGHQQMQTWIYAVNHPGGPKTGAPSAETTYAVCNNGGTWPCTLP